jgi:hypothetical protein
VKRIYSPPVALCRTLLPPVVDDVDLNDAMTQAVLSDEDIVQTGLITAAAVCIL